MSPRLDQAIRFATAKHRGQVDKGGQLSILHPLRVLSAVAEKYPDDDAMQMAAVLHDVVEDCGVTVHELSLRFGDDVAEIVAACTRDAQETYRQFIHRAKVHPKARIVKIADARDNGDEARLARIANVKLREVLRERSSRALSWLEEA